MDERIIRFPGRGAQMRKDRREHRVRCEVSPRWIQFVDRIDRHVDKDYLHLDIMTCDSNERDRKLCALVIDPQELQRVLSEMPVKDWGKE